MLSHERILKLHTAAISAGLASVRHSLIAGLDARIVACLPTEHNPSAQLLSDLHSLNAFSLGSEQPPLLLPWLENAAAIAAARPEEAVFRETARVCVQSHASEHGPPQMQRFEGPRAGVACPIPYFTGRASEYARLRDILTEPRPGRCLVLSGPGGVGKTSLIQHFIAVEAPSMFPDGCLWIDATNLERELPAAARRCGWNPNSEDEADEDDSPARDAARWLSHLLQRSKILLVVDNIDHRRVHTFELPVAFGPGRMVVTSRSAVIREDLGQPAAALTLGCWTPTEARDYVLAVSNRTPDARFSGSIELLTAAVGYLPLGVRLIAKHVARQGADVGRLLERLQYNAVGTLDAAATGADRGVAATFDAAFDALDADTRSVLLAIAACARSTRIPVVASVAHLPEAQVQMCIDRLVNDDALVEYSVDVPRPYGMHDLIRQFLRGKPGFAEARQAHFRSASRHADAHQDPLRWQEMDVDIAEALAAVDNAIIERNVQQAFELVQKVRSHLLKCHEPQTLEARLSAILPSLVPDSAEAKMTHLHLGICAARQAKHDAARRSYRRSLRIAAKRGELPGKALALFNLAITYQRESNYCYAVGYCRAALYLNERLGRRAGKVRQLRLLGRIFTDMGDIERALPLIEESRALKTKADPDQQKTIDVRSTLANCYTQLGRHEEAESLRLESLEASIAAGRSRGQVMILAALSNGYRLWADDAPNEQRAALVEKSLQRARKCLSLALALKYVAGEMEGLFSVGDSLRMTGQYDLALELLGRALTLTEQYKRWRFHAMVLLGYGRTLLQSGSPVSARDMLKRADAMFEKIGVRETHSFRRTTARILAQANEVTRKRSEHA